MIRVGFHESPFGGQRAIEELVGRIDLELVVAKQELLDNLVVFLSQDGAGIGEESRVDS